MRRFALPIILALIGIAAATYFLVRVSYGHATVLFEDGTVLTVEVAKSERARALGLGSRDALAEDAGMLFLFEESGHHAFWMKDMRFPIDIIWLYDGEVVDLNPDVPVGGEAPLSSYIPDAPVNQVLETNAGFVKGHEITVGDRLDIQEANR